MENVMAIISLKRKYTDIEFIVGIQKRDERITKAFFFECQKYFKAHFKAVFFADDVEDEVFQESFIILWSEIEHRRITVEDQKIFRKDRYGNVRLLTCGLTTFLLSIAKNKYREYVRENASVQLEENINNPLLADPAPDDADDTQNLRIEIVMDCLSKMPAGCKRLLTMFYYERMSLDEILKALSQYSSKDALKSGKSKCMNTLRHRVSVMFEQYHLMP